MQKRVFISQEHPNWPPRCMGKSNVWWKRRPLHRPSLWNKYMIYMLPFAYSKPRNAKFVDMYIHVLHNATVPFLLVFNEKTMQIWKKPVVASLTNKQNFIMALKDTYLESDKWSLFLLCLFQFLVTANIAFWLKCDQKMQNISVTLTISLIIYEMY